MKNEIKNQRKNERKKTEITKLAKLLFFLGSVCILSGCGEKQAMTQQAEQERETTVQEEGGSDADARTLDGDELPDAAKDNGSYEIVSNGVLFHIPKSFEVRIDDETGNIYINDENYNYELVMVVADGSYEESLTDKEHLMENAKKFDITVQKEVTEYTVNGKSYAYFTFEYNDGSGITSVVYTAATSDKKVGINLIRNSDITEEEVIDQIDAFLHNAEGTELADSTEQDTFRADFVRDGEPVSETRLKLGSVVVEAKVPEGYYYIDEFMTDYSYAQMFESEDEKISVTTYLYEAGVFESAAGYVEQQVGLIDPDDSSYSDVQVLDKAQEQVNGNLIIYGGVRYMYDSTTFTHIYAACTLPDRSMYLLDASTLYDEELGFDTIRDFMDFHISEEE
ncbi:MAG: hypothetical protein IJ711_03985 [Lachnospiraceae bacterium]|nr:hypothetical protein [Lachnospiraceae bacterium]